MFIEYRPTEYIAKNNLKQGLLGIIYIFHVPVIKKNVSVPDMWQSKTLDVQSMKAGQTSLQPVFSIANCCRLGRLMAIKNSVFFFSILVYLRR